jgi:HK97 family phage major capsid protein
MSDEIKSQEQLEGLMNNPDKFNDYIASRSKEVLGEAVKEQMDAALRDGAVKRPPMSEEAITKGATMEGKEFGGGWQGKDETKIDLAREAKGMDGKFKSFGEFLTTMAPGTISRGGFDARLKVLGESQGDQGGFLVPEQFTAQLLALALEASVVRQRAFRLPMTSLNLALPTIIDTTHSTTVFGGVRGYWSPESGSYTASEPTFGRVNLVAKKLTAYTSAANELLADSAISLEALLMRLFPAALAYFEDDAFVNGIGAGQPVGIINADALVTVAKETGQAATTIVAENIDKMYSRMLPSSRANAIWLAHPDTLPQIVSLSRSVGTGGSAVMMNNMAGAAPASIYGRPLIISEKCQTLGTAGDIFFVDLSYYVIGDRQSISMAASPHVRFQNDETVWRFTQRVDGRPWIESALTPRNGSNTLSPFVALATRS